MIARTVNPLLAVFVRTIQRRDHLRAIDVVVDVEDLMLRGQLDYFTVGKNL